MAMSLKHAAQCLVVVAVFATVTGLAVGQAFADGTPQLSASGAVFSIPARSKATWTLTLWSGGVRRAASTGIGGTLKVTVPRGTPCSIQADVTRNGKYYSGVARTFTGCGPPTTTTSTSTTSSTSTTTQPGWWHHGPGRPGPPFGHHMPWGPSSGKRGSLTVKPRAR